MYKVIIVLGCVIIVMVVLLLIIYFSNLRNAREDYFQLSEEIHITTAAPLPTVEPTVEPSEEPSEESAEPTPEPTSEPIMLPVNLSALQDQNSDVDGWIEVEGTGIDYPILYDSDGGDYYLDHTRKWEYSAAGSIYVQNKNSRDFVDFNTVIYGHNMKDGSMFAQLHRFEDEDFFEDNDTIVIYTEGSKLTYQIFAAYVRDNEHLLLYYAYDDEDDRQDYIDDIYDHDGYFNYDVEVTPDDRIISLSTCTGWTYTRLIVQGVLISEEPGVCVDSE